METISRSNKQAPITIQASDKKRPTLQGLAVVYYDGTPDTEYPIAPNMVERVKRGSIQLADDITATFNHNDERLLGRTPNTLTIAETDKGISYSLELGKHSYAKDLALMVKRGEVRGSSFTASINPKTDIDFTREGETTVQWIKRATLTEVSPVVHPSYTGTTAVMRAATEFNASQIEFEKRKQALEKIKAAHK